MKISVLICTYNRPRMLQLCLKALIDGSLEKPDEVVVVNGGGLKSNRIVSSFMDRGSISVKLVKTNNKNLAVSRNIGLTHCTGDVIAMTDDDVCVSPQWVKQIKELHYIHPEAGAVGGRIIGAGKKFIDRIADAIIFPHNELAGCVRTIAGANISYKKTVIDKVGAFDETLFRGEDVDYNWRILRLGSKIYYDPELVVHHYHRQKWKGLFKQIFMYGKAYYLVRRKWKDMYCVYPHGIHIFKDIGKLGYFFLGIFIEPLKSLSDEQGVFMKLRTLLVLVICNIIWKIGMITERLKQKLFIAVAINKKRGD